MSLCNAIDAYVITNDKHKADSVLEVADRVISDSPELAPIIVPVRTGHAMWFGSDDEIRDIVQCRISSDSIDEYDRTDIAAAYLKLGDIDKALQYINSICCKSKSNTDFKYLAVKS